MLETNNLRGGDARETGRVTASLARLLAHLARQSFPLGRLAAVVVTHDGLGAAEQQSLAATAGAPVHFVRLPEGTDYYAAKNLGFDAAAEVLGAAPAAGDDVVVFADSDCWPDPRWLQELLAPFADPAVAAVAGRTTYRSGLLGTAATAIDFLYFTSPLGADCTRNFYANNVAFRRRTFAERRFPVAPAYYRGPCQLLGARLAADGVALRFVPAARTVHRFPDRRAELVKLRLLRGRDAVLLAPALIDAYAPAAVARWAPRLGPVAPLGVLGTRFVYTVRALAREPQPLLARPATLALAAGLSALDVAGAMARRPGGAREDTAPPSATALSYHAAAAPDAAA